MKSLLFTSLIFCAGFACAEDGMTVDVNKDAHGAKVIQVQETNAGGRKMVTLLFKTTIESVASPLKGQYLTMSMGSVEIEAYTIPTYCKVLQYGQSSVSPSRTSLDVGVYVDGNGCEAVTQRLQAGGFRVTYSQAISGMGISFAPLVVFVRP